MCKLERGFFYTFPKTIFICANRLCFKIRSNLAGFLNTVVFLGLWLVGFLYSARDFYQPRVLCASDFADQMQLVISSWNQIWKLIFLVNEKSIFIRATYFYGNWFNQIYSWIRFKSKSAFKVKMPLRIWNMAGKDTSMVHNLW